MQAAPVRETRPGRLEPLRPRLFRDIILLGASMGGVEALCSVVSGLPSDIRAAVFVVLHTRRGRPDFCLPDVLDRAGPLSAHAAADGESIRYGHVYVAPPDRHLSFVSDRIRLDPGDNRDRWSPSLDCVFGSAAEVFGPRVAATVLTGMLDDGAAGLARVKACGGVAIVQDPHEAVAPEMPLHAIAAALPDYTLPLAAVPPVLSWLAGIGSDVAA